MEKEFYELVIEGPYVLVKGFITGLFAGSNKKGTVIFNKEKNIERESCVELLMEWIGVHENLTHVIVSGDIREMVTGGIEGSFDDIKLKVISNKKVIKASFGFEYRAFAKRYGIDLKDFFQNLPSGLSLLPDYNPIEEIHRGAEAAEGYAPEHAYEISAKGAVEGPLLEIIEFYEKAEKKDLIKLRKIYLHLE